MNQKILNRCVEFARALKPDVKYGKSHHVSFAIYKSKIICIGQNDYTKLHPHHKYGKYENYAKEYASEYKPCIHSEVSLAIRLGEDNWRDYEIVNVRVGNDGKVRSSKPCLNCENLIIKALKPKRLFYSDDNENFHEL